ncbi:MAG: UdgX family uracil-DNA binding protein [Candidatus Rokubacteria bacterium]|nr:UdgX family uracil-DNA binding protein [Candidatus Rokubacteria bacterium]
MASKSRGNARTGSAPPLPIEAAAAGASPAERASHLAELARRAHDCTGCDLYKRATQVVFGEGPVDAAMILVGEQPGDEEDRVGRPFVGPAGRLLDRALADAGLDRRGIYVTNAVKHFKWKTGPGKRRIHDRPRQDEVEACAPWFQQELWLVRPELVVCLGATAGRAVLGRPVRIQAERGRSLPTPFGVPGLITIHPSAILRVSEEDERRAAFAELVRDLETARQLSGRH